MASDAVYLILNGKTEAFMETELLQTLWMHTLSELWVRDVRPT